MTGQGCCGGPGAPTEGQKTEGCCQPKSGCCGMMGKLGAPNVGAVDRVIRAAAGGALLTLVFVGPETPWGWLGLLLIGSALIGWCGAYRVLGVKTTGCCK